ncbi:MAG TPA: hypothetical protein VGF81_14295 [Solirubrobacteraceae bacterium]|jgi:hypothetical protein
MAVERLVCAGCGAAYPPTDRFCRACGLPLSPESEPGDGQEVSERRRVARKVKPQLAEGALVRVAGARNQAEGEFIQGMLLEEGVPSVLRRTAGFDVPDFLAAGPRDVLVPQSGLATAREVLLEAEVIHPHRTVSTVSPVRLLAGLVLALVVGALVIWGLSALLS